METKFFGIINRNKFINELKKVFNTIFINKKDIGQPNGIASLDSSGNIPSSQLPSYVDDVIEVADYDHLPVTGESSKIYLTLNNNKSYRWTGSRYLDINEDKADKVSNAINGNFASLDSSGNLQDSGKKASDFEDVSNKVTALSAQSTDTQYPSAKCVYDIIGNVESLLASI